MKENILGQIWITIDRRTPRWMRQYTFNVTLYNTYTISSLVVESIPQLLLNLANRLVKGHFTALSLVSLFFSGTSIAYQILKVVLYVGIMDKDIKDFIL